MEWNGFAPMGILYEMSWMEIFSYALYDFSVNKTSLKSISLTHIISSK